MRNKDAQDFLLLIFWDIAVKVAIVLEKRHYE